MACTDGSGIFITVTGDRADLIATSSRHACSGTLSDPITDALVESLLEFHLRHDPRCRKNPSEGDDNRACFGNIFRHLPAIHSFPVGPPQSVSSDTQNSRRPGHRSSDAGSPGRNPYFPRTLVNGSTMICPSLDGDVDLISNVGIRRPRVIIALDETTSTGCCPWGVHSLRFHRLPRLTMRIDPLPYIRGLHSERRRDNVSKDR